MEIKNARAIKIINANSNFTIEVIIETKCGNFRGSSPKGESNSKYEVEQFSKGIDQEISAFNEYLKKLIGRTINSINDIFTIEKEIPPEFIGGPSLSLSYALIYALSNDLNKEPYDLFGKKHNVIPVCKMIGGGLHASGLGMDIQEILVTTITEKNKESIDTTLKVYKEVKRLLEKSTDSFLGGVDPEGGFISGLDNYESLKLVREAIENIIKESSMDIRLGIDFAASTFYKDGKYYYRRPIYGKSQLDRGEQIDLTKKLADEFDIFFVEDPVDQTLPDDYAEIMKNLNGSMVVGDDLTATTPERLEKVHSSINATLIKPNQVGLMYKVKEYSDLADKFKIDKVVSHRSEETAIPIISDVAAGLGAKYLKVGINRGERIEKINRLIELD
ncbi:MAG: Phosphopyruvate hydratase [Candidatus Parvarchaeum acidophilus ARMAN-5_'5-way FS']|jgi:enolase|uniref:phosphopyruvate hydratase n=2 Tax=Parvarchaeum acidophilus TaxID=662761 RepID=D6GWA0_PARA5|nr:MAG: Phosphopyruvate hydratase [Candidatus Parvarchaeum acidophilus ARMAN-5]EGD71919.1 MAG: Phosphopyruvate hydratase [Candidatus Parvarchaeum acidophilus ARMAN-5_'5-way FS']